MADGQATLLLKIKAMGAEALDNVVVTLGDVGKIVDWAKDKIVDAAKAMVDLVFEGSKVKQINAQFEFLAGNVGAVADSLKNDLVGATDGLADDTDVIKAASGALLLLGNQAGSFPKLMELATASSRVFGGTAVENFERITTAISSTRTMGLKHLGITIDQEAAYKKMAASLNIVVGDLSQAQQQQAILNAVLESGGGALKKAGENTDTVGESFQRLKISMAQLHEVAAKLANEVFGSTFSKVFKNIGGLVDQISEKITGTFGHGAEKAAANIKGLDAELTSLLKTKVSIDATGKDLLGNFNQGPIIEARIKSVREQLTLFNEDKMRLGKLADRQEIDSAKETSKLTEEQMHNNTVKKLELLASEKAQIATMELESGKAASAAKLVSDAEAEIIGAELTTKALETLQKANDDKLAKTLDFKEKEKLLINKYQLAEDIAKAKKRTQDLVDAETDSKAMLAHRDKSLSQIASLQSVKNKELATIGKAAAIAQITISTAEAAASSFKWGSAMGGPMLGSIFSGLAYAAGAAQIAKVSGVELAEGGIVMPRPGGTQATIGEAGQAEAVIPLDKMGGMGGGVTIIVNGGLLGDQASAREFAIAVDRQLLELRRNNESVSFDGRVV